MLPRTFRPNPTHQTSVTVLLHPYPIRVSYDQVRVLSPNLYGAYAEHIDMVLHLGVSPSGTSYSLEQQATRDGLSDFADVDGKSLDACEGDKYWSDCPRTLRTSLDFDDVFKRWQSSLLTTPHVSPDLEDVDIRISDSPGRFVCDFLYYCSLAEYRRHWKRSTNVDDDNDHDDDDDRDGHSDDYGENNGDGEVADNRGSDDSTSSEQSAGQRRCPKTEAPVIFMHMPSDTSEDGIRKSKLVTTALIRAMAESWMSKTDCCRLRT